MKALPKQVQQLADQGALFVVNHSAGKDSQAMLLELLDHVPADQILVVHAELPEADWPGLRDHIEATVPAGIEIRYCRATRTLLEKVALRHETRPDAPCWPGAGPRWCTSDLKRDPIAKTVRGWLKEHPDHSKVVVHCEGIRAQESSQRSKRQEFSPNKRESKAGRQVWTWYPIFNLTEDQVFARIAAAGQQAHWAYQAGMSRLSCSFCIYGRPSDLRIAARLRPDLARKYLAMEESTGYTMHVSQRSLKDLIGDAADLT